VPRCKQCGDETQMYVNEVPLCVACDEMSKAPEPNGLDANCSSENREPGKAKSVAS
jgi:hypothetical protein